MIAKAADRARAIAASIAAHDARWLAPAVLPLAALPFLLASVRGELKEPIFSDTLVFQYAGWCIRHGLRLYRDIGMADGPFIFYLHAAVQILAGTGDRAFRGADLILQALGGAAMGVAAAGPFAGRRCARWAEGAVWAAAGAAIWLSWYFTFGWATTTQREAFYGLFGSTGMALLFAAGSGGARRAARAKVCTVVGAALVMSQVFGKPTGVMYPAAGLLTIVLPDAASPLALRARVRAFLAGCGACFAAVLVLVALTGSVAGYFHWCWRIPYVGNRFLYRQNWLSYVLTGYWERYVAIVAMALVGGVAAIGAGLVPVRALGIVLLPPVAFLGACLQARGYDYHVMPSIAAAHLVLLVVLARLWRRDGPTWTQAQAGLAAAGLLFAGAHVFSNLRDSRYKWSGDDGAWDKPAHTHQDLEKEVGRYIRAHTKPDDWAFSYGPNAHVVLLYAERRTASPYLHPYFLDPVGILPQSRVQPSPRELAALEELQADDRRAACEGIVAHAPAALALSAIDASIAICPGLRRMIDDDFVLEKTMGAYRVYLRKRR